MPDIKRFTLVLGAALICASVPTSLANASSDNGNVVNETFSVHSAAFNDCNGELVELNGSVHMVENVTDNGTYLINTNEHLTGLGSSGNQYVLNASNHSTSVGSSFSGRAHDVLVSKGPAPNEIVTIMVSFPPFLFQRQSHLHRSDQLVALTR